MQVNQIRNEFLEFFKSNSHEVVKSSPLVPHNDPTLMFTNAGMVQFKDVFTQNETRSYKRAASSQKCVRAGGKHNDLDNVGYTARHHTFFEMLGNFSFGDYFKEEAIEYAYKFLTKTAGIDPSKLLVTVYHDDDEAFSLWKKIAGFSDDRIIRIASSDNFWSMGDTGPCGPCSEIFFDHGEHIKGGKPGSADQDGDRFIEIWNLVFMQYEQKADGSRIKLPKPAIDTGMGLERIAAVLQNVHDNYDIDLFKNLISASRDLSHDNDKSTQVSHRVIADHLRSVTFLLADGVMPSNEGRGYVLRRIMRRAMRHARHIGQKQPFLFKLVPYLTKEMGASYPEIVRAEPLIVEVLKLEEERFGQTIEKGLKLLEESSQNLKSGSVFDGGTAFKLYDTYGFPLDLTTDILRQNNITVDEQGFNAAMQEQKDRARAAWRGSGAKATDEVWFDIKEQYGATEFLGYNSDTASAKIVAMVKDSKIITEANVGEEVAIILNQTPFYGESGGQQGDKGEIFIGDANNSSLKLLVKDTKKYLGAIHVHIAEIVQGVAKTGSTVTAKIDSKRRQLLVCNHSATHILHASLRKILGSHVVQKGSEVAADYLRFDFSHPKALTSDEIKQVEFEVNQIIRTNYKAATTIMSQDEAVKQGAMALFGEKYGDEVRVVSIGDKEQQNFSYSVELCGGTHVRQSGDIGLFKISAEIAVAAGVRRIEALTGEAALNYIAERNDVVSELAAIFKVSPKNLVSRVNDVLEERKKLEKELAAVKKNALLTGDNKIVPEQVNGIKLAVKFLPQMPPKDLRDLALDTESKHGDIVVVLATVFEDKAAIVVTVSNGLTSKINATDLVKTPAEILGAKGSGGKPNFAQTGGANIDKVDAALDAIKSYIIKL